jgi:ribosomal protein S10
MSGVAVIKLASISKSDADGVMKQIKDIAQSIGVKVKGPIPLPTKRIKHAVRKPHEEATYRYRKWHKRKNLVWHQPMAQGQDTWPEGTRSQNIIRTIII